MIAVIDLERTPPQYDILTALVTCELERIRRNAQHLDIVFAAGLHDGYRRNDFAKPYPMDAVGLMRRIADPACWLLPSVASVAYEPNRARVEKEFGFNEKLYGFPQQLKNLSTQYGRPLRYEEWFAGPIIRDERLVTITLRESLHWPERNSNILEWVRAAYLLRNGGWRIVFVRDTAKATEPIKDFDTMPEASMNLFVRAKLYASAFVNLFVNSGPAALALYMNLPLLNFRPSCLTHHASSPSYIAECGFPYGSQLPNAPPWQRYVWEDDRADIIVNAVNNLKLSEALCT